MYYSMSFKLDKQLQHNGAFILCAAPFHFCFVIDQNFKLAMLLMITKEAPSHIF